MSSRNQTRAALAPAAAIARIEALLAAIPQSLPLLALRLALAVPFFKSGMTKWAGFLQLSDGARYLFTEEFRLHLFGAEVPYPFPITMATPPASPRSCCRSCWCSVSARASRRSASSP